MFWFLYNILFAVGYIALLPHFLMRMKRRGGYARNFSQRFAHYAPEILERLQRERRVWIHAVSVGELYVALKLMKEWRARAAGARFVLTVNTSTAHAIAERELPVQDVLLYFPADFPWIARRALDAINPGALVLVEVELWPNLIRFAHKRGVPVILANGRLSDRSFGRYRKVKFLSQRILPMVDMFCMQSQQDADRIVALGAPQDRVRMLGTAKYDVATVDHSGEVQARNLLRAAGVQEGDKIFLGGSTWPGEEGLLLDVFKGLKTRYRNLVLVLAPRHAERTPEVVQEIKAHMRTFVRRSEMKSGNPPRASRPDVFLLDTTGELKNFYSCADVIFIGKSLTQHGGQNIIEPALLAKPIVVGPNMENFKSVMEDFLQAGAIAQIKNLQDLRRTIDDLMADDKRRRAMGDAAAKVVAEKSGAIARTLDLLEPILSPPQQ